MNKELEKVVRELEAAGITDEDEQIKIIMRDHGHLLPTPTTKEAMNAETERLILELNRESFAEFGHPAFVCKRIDGVMKYRNYKTLSPYEKAQLIAEGIILETGSNWLMEDL